MAYIPPADVAETAARALDIRAAQTPSNRAGTPVGIARAVQLAQRRPVSIDTIQRMISFFARHEVDKQANSWKDPASQARQAWGLWGGDPGRAWANRIWREYASTR